MCYRESGSRTEKEGEMGPRKTLRSPTVMHTSTKSSGALERKRERNPGRKQDRITSLRAGCCIKFLSPEQDDVRALKSP
jgi:hypothetical protein